MKVVVKANVQVLCGMFIGLQVGDVSPPRTLSGPHHQSLPGPLPHALFLPHLPRPK